MKITRWFIPLLFIVLVSVSCEEEIISSETSIAKPKESELISTTQEPFLAEVLDLAGFAKSSKGRTHGSGVAINADSVFKVLQADSSSYSYTFRVDSRTTATSFTNLVFKKITGGFRAFYLVYKSDHLWPFDMTTFTGKVTSYDLSFDEITSQYFVNGIAAVQPVNGRTQNCLPSVDIESVCTIGGGTSSATGLGLPCFAYATIITLNYSRCSEISNDVPDYSQGGGGRVPYVWSAGDFILYNGGGGGGSGDGSGGGAGSCDNGDGISTPTGGNSCSDVIGVYQPTTQEILGYIDWPGKDNNYPYMWWGDDQWINDNIVLAPDENYKLTEAERALIKLYPQQAYEINSNVTIAIEKTQSIFGANGLNDKSDAFRHAFFNAMNERDCSEDNITLESVAKMFADAHESEVPPALIKEKEMDLWNNAVGLNIGNVMFPIFTSDESLANDVMEKLNSGLLRYLFPTLPPPFDSFGNPISGGDPNFNVTHGITSSTVLTPTNQ